MGKIDTHRNPPIIKRAGNRVLHPSPSAKRHRSFGESGSLLYCFNHDFRRGNNLCDLAEFDFKLVTVFGRAPERGPADFFYANPDGRGKGGANKVADIDFRHDDFLFAPGKILGSTKLRYLSSP